MFRTTKAVLTATALIAVGLGMAVPVHAAASPVAWYVGCDSGTGDLVLYDNMTGRTGDTGTMTASAGDSVSINNYTASPMIGCTGAPFPLGYALDVLVNGTVIASNTVLPGSITLASGDSVLSVKTNLGTPANTYAITISGTGGGGGGGTPSSSTSPAAVQETLTLSATTNGTTCTGGNPSGYTGSWLALPSADDCTQTGPDARTDAVLLGWSTSPNFPVARAQDQTNRGWGVIDEEIGGIRMIFIPGGMSTFVSSSNTLYPIWSA